MDSRFDDVKTEEYDLVANVMPHFTHLQQEVGRLAREHMEVTGILQPHALDIGCGNGVTSVEVFKAVPGVVVDAIDPEPEMLRQAREKLPQEIREHRCNLLQSDALTHLSHQSSNSLNLVFSALTLHNLKREERAAIHGEIYRVLVPGGIFVNADKFAPRNDDTRFEMLGVAVSRFFDTLVPLQKFDLLKEWVLHNLADQAQVRCMREDETIVELLVAGFQDVTISGRQNLEAILLAHKP
jgi:tRNA (cmo5U34)-methyltransferase